MIAKPTISLSENNGRLLEDLFEGGTKPRCHLGIDYKTSYLLVHRTDLFVTDSL